MCLEPTLTAAVVLWRAPVGRLRARLVRDATILTGLDYIWTLRVLLWLAQAFRPGSIVVTEPDAGYQLLDEARDRGPRYGQPAVVSEALPVVMGGRGCSLGGCTYYGTPSRKMRRSRRTLISVDRAAGRSRWLSRMGHPGPSDPGDVG